MDIMQNINDYIKTDDEKNLAQCLKGKLYTNVCGTKIKNKNHLRRYLQPKNDFIIHTTAMPCTDAWRVLA